MEKPICAVEQCGRVSHCRGWCRTHYTRWRETGDPGVDLVRQYRSSECSVDACERPHLARGFCSAHYSRWKTKGDPGPAAIQIKDPSRKCVVEGCEIKAAGHGLCRTHLARTQRTGTTGSSYIKHLTDPTERNEAGEKRCPSCEAWLPVAEYTKCASTPDGLWKRCRTCTRAASLWSRYGLTLQAYEALLAEQGGGCRICSRPPDGLYSLHVDHDHTCCSARKNSCGKCIRGLLCSPCNTALGLLMDDPARLRAAADYLERGRARG